MKIAITGHTAGIGKAFASNYQQRGHDIIGLSKRDGWNIRNVPKIATEIEPCDMWINNAQESFFQTELLFEMVKRWQGSRKQIMVISTMMTQQPISSMPDLAMDYYRIQKIALEEAVRQIRYRRLGVQLTLIRPGNIATTPDKTVPQAADVDHWVDSLIKIFDISSPYLEIPEISLGPAYN